VQDATITRVRPGAVLPKGQGGPGIVYLTVLTGEAAGSIIALHQRRISVGRGENADIRVHGSTISRNHAQLQMDAEGFVKITDIGSRNGTFLNGVTVQSEVLRDGDRLVFGGELVTDVRYAGPRAAPLGSDQAGLPAMHVSSPPTPGFDHTVASYEKLVDLRERRLGPNHPGVAVALDALASVYRHEGELERTLSAYQRVEAIQEVAEGVRDTERAQTRFRVARCLTLLGRLKEAEQALESGYGLLQSGSPQRGEEFEYHIVWACLLDLQGSEGADIHLKKAQSLASESNLAFSSAKKALLTETLNLLSRSMP